MMFCTDISAPIYFIFSDSVPKLLYYSHIPTAIITLLLGFFVFFKNRTLASRLLLAISVTFSLWLFLNLIVWTIIDSGQIMFVWSFFGSLTSLIFILSFYFTYVFIRQKDLPLAIKIILGVLFLPVIALMPYYLKTFDLVNCEAVDNINYVYYYNTLSFIIFSWVLLFSFLQYRKAADNLKQQIIYLTLGIELFLFAFFITGFLASYLDVQGVSYAFELEQYGLFGMTFFMGVLAYMIVKFKAFDIKLIGAQALVVTQFILIASIFTFATSTVNRILVAITLLITSGAGWFLVQSVKKEVKRKEELQRLSDKLAAANERLRQLDIEKSEFISIASHQLRTPLTAIKGYISLILEGSYGTVTASIQDVLEKVYSVNSRLVHLVEDLLNVSRIEAGRIQYNFELTQLEPLVAELVDMFAPTAKNKGLTLQMRLPKVPLPKLTVDPNKIKEVVSNLIDNSLKYTKEGGTTVTLEQAGDQARIIVSDTGIGIKPADLGKLFEKFVRTKETAKMVASGTGLGLFVGRNFVEAHGGRIWAESPAVPSEGGQAPVKGEGAGKGSRFIVELPLVNPKIKEGTSDQVSFSGR